MFCIGNVSEENQKLVRVAKECVELGLQQVKPWGHLGDVAQAIQDHAKENGYSVVRQVGGHGIGLEFHEAPYVSYVIKKGTGMVMAPGMVFTIEPMINMEQVRFTLMNRMAGQSIRMMKSRQHSGKLWYL